ncbi:MAG: hypothetical protein ABIG61_07755 [Planctomycetota bacterium]
MNNELYFIPILQEALKQPDRQKALSDALYKIDRFGKSERFKEGFQNFISFVTESYQRHYLIEENQSLRQIVDLLSESFESLYPETNGVELSGRGWKEKYLKIAAFSQSTLPLEITIFGNNQLVGSVSLAQNNKSQKFSGITPGNYTIRFSTGRTLWKGEIIEKDLMARKTLDGQIIKLAADSGDFKARPSRIVTILKDQVVLKIFKGLYSGVIQIELG